MPSRLDTTSRVLLPLPPSTVSRGISHQLKAIAPVLGARPLLGCHTRLTPFTRPPTRPAAQYKATGQELLDKVLATLDVRESWYFDIMYDNTKDMNTFVNRSHKVFVGSHKPGARPNRFRLVIKFYPEDVVELVQPETRHLFFLQLLYCVTAGELACPSEAAVLLASYAIQAKYGNYDSQAHVPGFLSSEVILPSRITGQANSTPRLWEEKIIQ